jgi:hypothetical protein
MTERGGFPPVNPPQSRRGVTEDGRGNDEEGFYCQSREIMNTVLKLLKQVKNAPLLI